MSSDRAAARGIPRRCASVESITYGRERDRSTGLEVSKRARVQCYHDAGHAGLHMGRIAGVDYSWEEQGNGR